MSSLFPVHYYLQGGWRPGEGPFSAQRWGLFFERPPLAESLLLLLFFCLLMHASARTHISPPPPLLLPNNASKDAGTRFESGRALSRGGGICPLLPSSRFLHEKQDLLHIFPETRLYPTESRPPIVSMARVWASVYCYGLAANAKNRPE